MARREGRSDSLQDTRKRERENRPASSPLPPASIFSSVFSPYFSYWPISMTFRGNRARSLYYKVDAHTKTLELVRVFDRFKDRAAKDIRGYIIIEIRIYA